MACPFRCTRPPDDPSLPQPRTVSDHRHCPDFTALLELEAEIHEQEASLAENKARRCVLRRKINDAHDSFSRLPFELVSRIFAYIVPEDVDDSYTFLLPPKSSRMRPTTTPLILGAVCQNWRSIAWSTSELWTSLSFDLFTASVRPLVKPLEAWLSKSGNLPLSLRLYHGRHPLYRNRHFRRRDYDTPLGNMDNLRGIFGVLNRFNTRWKYLELAIPKPLLRQFLSSSPHSVAWTKVETLELCTSSPTRQSAPEAPFDINAMMSPTRVYIHGLGVAQLKLNWTKLAHIEIHGNRLEDFFDILQRVPLLESLSLDEPRMPNVYEHSFPVDIICHHHLRSLSITFNPRLPAYTTNIASFFACTAFPELDDLTFDGTDILLAEEPAFHHLPNSLPRLRTLRIMNAVEHVNCENLIRLLRCFPSLTCLELELHTNESEEDTLNIDPFLDLLADPGSTSTDINGTPPLLPHLETLTLKTFCESVPWNRLGIIFGPRVSYPSTSPSEEISVVKPDYRRPLRTLQVYFEKDAPPDSKALEEFISLIAQGINISIVQWSPRIDFMKEARLRFTKGKRRIIFS